MACWGCLVAVLHFCPVFCRAGDQTRGCSILQATSGILGLCLTVEPCISFSLLGCCTEHFPRARGLPAVLATSKLRHAFTVWLSTFGIERGSWERWADPEAISRLVPACGGMRRSRQSVNANNYFYDYGARQTYKWGITLNMIVRFFGFFPPHRFQPILQGHSNWQKTDAYIHGLE